MQKLFFLLTSLLSLCGWLGCQPQVVPERLRTNFLPLDSKLAQMLTPDALAISPTEAQSLSNPIYLDAREVEEYRVSHLPGSLRIGYDSPDFSLLSTLDKNRPIVVYCTIGYRSERMAQQIRKRGFTQVYNLYGSIYAWDLADYPLQNADGKPTKKVHTYNKKWSSFYPGKDAVY